MAYKNIPAMIIRGGTSKGVFFRREDLPNDRDKINEIVLRIMGNPDPKQIDGIGGGRPTTSKVMIVDKDSDPEVDLNYLFGQVSLDQPVIDWGGNCGNLTYAIGPFGLEAGLIKSEGNSNTVDINLINDNTGVKVEQSIPIKNDGMPKYNGDFKMYGIPGTGAPINSKFIDPGGAVTGQLLPTGNPKDSLDISGIGTIDVSVVDVSNPVVFLRPEDVGLGGAELPSEVDSSTIDILNKVRNVACSTIGLSDSPEKASEQSPNLPMISLVAPPESYETIGGESIEPSKYDVLARNFAMETLHYAFAITGGMCTAAATQIPGTIPYDQIPESPSNGIRIGHPMGTMKAEVNMDNGNVSSTSVKRTARKIMEGDIFL